MKLQNASEDIVNLSASGAAEVTPHDSNLLTYKGQESISKGVYIGVSGNLKVTMANGDAVTYLNIPAGFHPINVSIIWATGTTATDIIALY